MSVQPLQTFDHTTEVLFTDQASAAAAPDSVGETERGGEPHALVSGRLQ